MIRRVDDAVADLIRLLKDLKIDDNTMIVFTSDNGPTMRAVPTPGTGTERKIRSFQELWHDGRY